jgi:hypothetical protein
MDYIPITEAETDPEAPSTSSLWKRFWKNPLAMFEGAAGAPRLQAGAIAAGAIDQIISGQPVGGLGTYAILGRAGGGSISQGAIIAGSGLRWSGFHRGDTGGLANSRSSSSPSGSWRAMGFCSAGTFDQATLFVRVL